MLLNLISILYQREIRSGWFLWDSTLITITEQVSSLQADRLIWQVHSGTVLPSMLKQCIFYSSRLHLPLYNFSCIWFDVLSVSNQCLAFVSMCCLSVTGVSRLIGRVICQ
jgi:hypothetical protein